MIKKIEEEGDIENLTIGTILTKYPTSGEFSEQIDFTNHGDLLQYEIHAINKDAQILSLKMPDKNVSDSEVLPVETFIAEGLGDNPLVLNKPFQDLITDKIWWYEQ